VNNDNFLVEESDLEQARDICKYIKDPNTRSRAVATALAANLAEKYFVEIEADVKTGIHNIGTLAEALDVADIYLNGSYVDVRLYFENGEMTIPKYNFDNDLKPIAYMFIKLEEELSGGLVTGFVLPTSIDTTKSKDGYYIVTEDDLVSFYDVQPLLITPDDIDIPDDFDKQAFELLDGKLENPIELYKILLASQEAREKIATMANVQTIFNFVSFDAATVESSVTTSEKSEDDFLELVDTDELTLTGTDDLDIDFEADDSSVLIDSEDENDTVNFEDNDNLIQDFTIDNNDNSEDLLLENTEDEISIDLGHDSEILLNENIEENNNLLEESPSEDRISDFSGEDIGFASIEEPSDTIDNLEVLIEPENNDSLLEETALDVSNSEENSLAENNTSANNGFEFSTAVTPSLSVLEEESLSEQPEENDNEEVLTTEDIANLVNEDDSFIEKENEEVIESAIEDEIEVELNQEQSVSEDIDNNENAEQIETLFGDEESTEEGFNSPFAKPNAKKSAFIPILSLLILLIGLGGAGYYFYNKTLNPDMQAVDSNEITQPQETQEAEYPVKQQDAADKTAVPMPNETVENEKRVQNSNEGTSVSIPAIEQHLDTSVLVSNLKVYWEVPSGYLTNNTVQRYFRKLGKIIQLNLKTELLLLSKPPITNKIIVELQYNKTTQNYEVKGMKVSSGEKKVDEVITNTVKNALNMNLKANTSSFKALSGNPMLVIRL